MSNFSVIYYNFIIPQVLFVGISWKKFNLFPQFSPFLQPLCIPWALYFWTEQEIINHISHRQCFILSSISAHDKKDPPPINNISSILLMPSKTRFFPALWSQSLIMLTLRCKWLIKQCPSSYGHLRLRGFLLTCTSEYLLIECDKLGDWEKRSLWKNLYNITT